MPIDFVSTPSAPSAIGPYSQAHRANGLLFTAGQVALDPAKGELVAGGIAEQTERALENLRAILTPADCDFSQVVKTTVFLVDMADFTAMNEVYARRLRRSSAGPLHRRGRGPAARCAGRDRGDRAVSR